jgi:acyl-CoA synthetase (AMP-forming)/AMP-acid ligase II
VELALAEHPDVAEATVFAVPDPLRTEEVFAAVVRRPDAEVDPSALRAFCAQRLVRWKLPRYIAVLDQPLPRLANGKLDRVNLRESLKVEAAWDDLASPARRRG